MNIIKVNHVLSKEVHSGIFEAIFRYFEKYSENKGVKHYFSVYPKDDMDIYHYHRPNLEHTLLDNTFTTVHHDLMDTDPWLNFEKFLNIYKKMDRIVCLNREQQDILNSHGIDNTVVIPWGYNEDIFSINNKKLESYSENDKVCLGVISKRYGRKVKGEALLYELVKRLSPKDFKFILVGDGRSESTYYLSNLGYEVEGFDYLPYRVFNSLYESLDALLITSFYEGGPANVPEAFAKGVPIISTPVGFAQDFIINNENGIILTKNPNEDAQSIESILDKEFLNKLKSNAKKMRKKMLTWEDIVDKYNQEYKLYIVNKLAKENNIKTV